MYFSILTRFFQIRYIKLWLFKTAGKLIKKDKSAHKKEINQISQFQSVCSALASTIGVGNISGVASAIVFGGPGAIFWMWVSAFFGMMTIYAENVLGIYYRRKNPDGTYLGGAMCYLKDGLAKSKGFKLAGSVLAALFSLFTILASFGMGNMGQVNKITLNIKKAFPINKFNAITLYGDITFYNLFIGISISILSGIMIFGGLKCIADFSEKVVPLMICLFLCGSLFVILTHYQNIKDAFIAIFTHAFSKKSMWGGAGGIGVKTVVSTGLKRGLFSNEAGLGSTVIVHSSSNIKEPCEQGMWAIFEAFINSIVICTTTALVVLTSGVIDLNSGIIDKNSSEATLVADAFSSSFGSFGIKFVSICLFLFAFTTILGWSHYGEKATEYIFGCKAKKLYRSIYIGLIVFASLISSSAAWEISDAFNVFMMIPNLVGILLLSKVVLKITDNYLRRTLYNSKERAEISAFKEQNFK